MNENESLLPPYVPTRRSVRWLGGLFVLSAAVSWVAVGYDFSELRLATSGKKAVPEIRLAHVITGEWVGRAQLVCLLVTGSQGGPRENCGTIYRTRSDVAGLPLPAARV